MDYLMSLPSETWWIVALVLGAGVGLGIISRKLAERWAR